ncbi:hypothetical protein WA171_006062 [Blastocystis sp. BT1]
MEDSTKRTCTALLLPLPTDEGNDSDEIKRIKQGPCKEEEEIIPHPTDVNSEDEQQVVIPIFSLFQTKLEEFCQKYAKEVTELIRQIDDIRQESTTCIAEIDNDREAVEKQLSFLTEKTLHLQQTIFGLVGHSEGNTL